MGGGTFYKERGGVYSKNVLFQNDIKVQLKKLY